MSSAVLLIADAVPGMPGFITPSEVAPVQSGIVHTVLLWPVGMCCSGKDCLIFCSVKRCKGM